MSAGNTDVTAARLATALTVKLPEQVESAEYEACPVTKMVRLLGDKWILLVLMLLAERPHRFNELRRRISGISQRMLTRTLQTLTADGLVARTVHPTVPPAVDYSLTDQGRSLLVPLTDLADWVVRRQAA
ncbi:winged helix-turn-helix transcriptional regulator [Pseudofrankia saprophytica]|uniref:winged helix-turn-helix transcriptional regulator n=1 Tax=Pseudofrankia saprophytica TaxID=298655 RepID=UPI000234D3CE|nr:helix-turn-helix domain-containing protein [Pseudofrankia saprophytica]